ncbi:ATP-grasp enzyme fsqD-like protein [Cladobotryum mycophilum]|uniref:ATP-grasp enzyme fsqD-like protein n=1 Tax=Cladobotryum mycophilum TaxID=491253 RepID=A0ABR0T044_9HYPO
MWSPTAADLEHTCAINLQVQLVDRAHSTNDNIEKLPSIINDEALAVLDCLASTAHLFHDNKDAPTAWIKLILPAKSGYVARSDFLKLRMVACPQVHSVHHFVKPQQYLDVPDVLGVQPIDFAKALSGAAGAIIVLPSQAADFDVVMKVLDEELANRLAYPWIVQSPLTRNRLVIVNAKGSFAPEEKQFGAVEQYIEVDMTRDEQLTSRIVDMLSSGGPYYGIVTFIDTYMIHTAETVTALRFYILPLNLVKTCLDKYATRLFYQDVKDPLRITGLADLQDKLKSPDIRLEYPLIIKPYLLINSYINGPEVDANFVLLDEKILCFEMVDGFPCSAEVPNGGKLGDLIKTDQIWPSNHPQREKNLVRDKLHDLLLKMGIRDSVFHVKAQIRNSTLQYQARDSILNLYPQSTLPIQDPSGTPVSYSIDYPTLHMFYALRELKQYQALSRPFEQGAVQHVDSVFINSDTNGTYTGGGLYAELKEQRPDLIEYVQHCNTCYENGEAISDLPARIALFVVASPISRREVLEISHELRAAVKVWVTQNEV